MLLESCQITNIVSKPLRNHETTFPNIIQPALYFGVSRLYKQEKGDYEGARDHALEFSEIFQDRYYLEIQNHGIAEEEQNIKNKI